MKTVGRGILNMLLAALLIAAICLPSFSHAGSYQHALRLMATTAYHEARSDGLRGMVAVCLVIRNRMKQDPGLTVADVVHEKAQFSVWNRRGAAHKTKLSKTDPHYRQALRAAHSVLSGRARDFTLGSTYYHEISIRPAWARKFKPVIRVGRHQFYREK